MVNQITISKINRKNKGKIGKGHGEKGEYRDTVGNQRMVQMSIHTEGGQKNYNIIVFLSGYGGV